MIYEVVKRGIIQNLKKVKNLPVLMSMNEDREGLEEYFVLKIKPISALSKSVNMGSESYLIDIIYDNSQFTTEDEYYSFTEEIDNVFRPTLDLNEFAIFVDELKIFVSDSLLHYVFSIHIKGVDEEKGIENNSGLSSDMSFKLKI